MQLKQNLIPLGAMVILLGLGSWLVKPVESIVPDIQLRFTDVAADINCRNTHSKVQLAPEFNNIMPWLSSVGAAVAAGDFDNDGLTDFYATNCGRNSYNKLFRNKGNGSFEEVAERAGVHDCNRTGASMDALFFDYDNDGDQDLYVVKWAATNILFENDGSGNFSDVSARAGVNYWGYANGVISFDYNRDGLADIFVCNYFAQQVENPATGALDTSNLWNPVSTEVMHSTFTHAVNGGVNILYKNMGDGTFKDVTAETGLAHTGWSLDAAFGDLNNDGWPDLYVANDFGADELYYNTGVTEADPAFRIVIDHDGHPGIGSDWWKGMNAEMGDVNNDGRMDIYVTNILARKYKTDEGNMLWLNKADPSKIGNTGFINISESAGTHDGGWGWAGKFCDFNNDGLPDIFTVNGFATGSDRDNTYWYALQEMVTQTKNNAADTRVWPPMQERDLSGYEPSRLFIQMNRLDGELQFLEMAIPCGITDLYNGRGIALNDYDNDGDIDMYIANQGVENCFYRNDLKAQTNWIGFSLTGSPDMPRKVGERVLASTRDALGARIELWTAEGMMVRELNCANGFASQSESRLHFGIGQSTAVEKVVIKWPSGRETVLQGSAIQINKYHDIREHS